MLKRRIYSVPYSVWHELIIKIRSIEKPKPKLHWIRYRTFTVKRMWYTSPLPLNTQSDSCRSGSQPRTVAEEHADTVESRAPLISENNAISRILDTGGFNANHDNEWHCHQGQFNASDTTMTIWISVQKRANKTPSFLLLYKISRKKQNVLSSVLQLASNTVSVLIFASTFEDQIYRE